MINAVVENAIVPAYCELIVHVYVDKDADEDKALAIINNAKPVVLLPGNAMEVLLFKDTASSFPFGESAGCSEQGSWTGTNSISFDSTASRLFQVEQLRTKTLTPSFVTMS